MPAADHQIKVYLNGGTAYQLRQLSLQQATSVSDVARRIIEANISPPKPTSDVEVETKRGGRVAAAYLSDKLADCVQQLAAQSGHSQSWHIRDLIRSELRNRGILPPSPSAPAVDTAA